MSIFEKKTGKPVKKEPEVTKVAPMPIPVEVKPEPEAPPPTPEVKALKDNCAHCWHPEPGTNLRVCYYCQGHEPHPKPVFT